MAIDARGLHAQLDPVPRRIPDDHIPALWPLVESKHPTGYGPTRKHLSRGSIGHDPFRLGLGFRPHCSTQASTHAGMVSRSRAAVHGYGSPDPWSFFAPSTNSFTSNSEACASGANSPILLQKRTSAAAISNHADSEMLPPAGGDCNQNSRYSEYVGNRLPKAHFSKPERPAPSDWSHRRIVGLRCHFLRKAAF